MGQALPEGGRGLLRHRDQPRMRPLYTLASVRNACAPSYGNRIVLPLRGGTGP